MTSSAVSLTRTWRWLLLIGPMALVSANASHAATIYEVTGGTTPIDVVIEETPTLAQATRFQTTATDYVVTNASFDMRKDPADPPTGTLTWQILTNSINNLPGSVVSGGNILSLDVSTLTTSYATVSTGPLNVTLTPLTNYWLVFGPAGLTSGAVQVQGFVGPTGTGSPFLSASLSGNPPSWASSSTVAPRGTITAVPEPGTLILGVISAGIAALAACRRKRGGGVG